jgi:hypothetical protein
MFKLSLGQQLFSGDKNGRNLKLSTQFQAVLSLKNASIFPKAVHRLVPRDMRDISAYV